MPICICDIAQFYSPLSGGVRRYLSDKQRYLADLPGARHVLIIPSARNAVVRTKASTVYEIKSPRLPGSRSYRLLLARRQILRVVLGERPDLIEVGDPYRTAWIGLEAGRRLGVPVVSYYHSDFPRAIGRTVRRFVGRWLEWMIAQRIQRYLVRLHNRMNTTVVATRRLQLTLAAAGIERIVQVPLGTDTRRFFPRDSRERIRAELRIPAAARLLLFAGRLAREKNIRNLIVSLDTLSASPPPCHLVLVGDGELHEFVAKEAARRRNLTWLPHCDSAERLAQLYSAADLFVHAGQFETFGLVVLEAQACGTPVLAVRGGGVEEALVETPPLLACDGSAVSLAAAIAAAFRKEDTVYKREARALAVRRRFSTEATFDRMVALYRHLIAHRSVEDFPSLVEADHELLRASV